VNERRSSSAILTLGAVLAFCITLCGPAENCPAQTTLPATQPATQPAVTAAPPSVAPAKPTPGWYVQPLPQIKDQTAAEKAVAAKATIGSLDSRTGHVFQVEVVREDAAIRTIKLADYFTKVTDKSSFERDPDAYMERINQPGADDGHYTVLNHVQHNKKRYLPLATTIYAKVEGEEKFSKLRTRNRWRINEKAKSGENDKTESISFDCLVYRGVTAVEAAKNPAIKLTKTYTISKKDYTVKVSLTAQNLTAEKILLRVDQAGTTGVPMESHRGDERYVVWGQLAEDGVNVDIMVEMKTALTKEEHFKERKEIGTTAGQIAQGDTEAKPAVLWLGQGNRFFASLLYLNPEADRKEAANYNASVWRQAAYETPESLTHITGIDIPSVSIAANSSKTIKFDLFAGPKRRAMFTNVDDEFFKPQYADLNYVGAISMKGCSNYCTFELLTFGMMWLLNVFASVAFGNYGIAIFMLVILVRLVLHPLSKKGQISMAKTQKAMKKIQPRLAKIKEKYANDADTLRKETMKLYKEKGANPMSSMLGCLPMMLQMPIWIALWTGLNAAVELRHTGLLPFWITDLAAPDALISFGMDVPIIGPSLNLLPLLLTVAMFLQTKMNPATSTPTSPEQETQMKMMKYMMPGMMLMFFYNAPSGLSLYIMTSISGGIIEGIFIRKHIAEKDAAEEAKTPTVVGGGKAFRESRGKKPKSPYKKPW
jgi:YidC/Oxa1 family membrane protein insertase